MALTLRRVQSEGLLAASGAAGDLFSIMEEEETRMRDGTNVDGSGNREDGTFENQYDRSVILTEQESKVKRKGIFNRKSQDYQQLQGQNKQNEDLWGVGDKKFKNMSPCKSEKDNSNHYSAKNIKPIKRSVRVRTVSRSQRAVQGGATS